MINDLKPFFLRYVSKPCITALHKSNGVLSGSGRKVSWFCVMKTW